MKSKKRASPRRKINFAVDRDEIEVNSDWVDAVMALPTRPAAEQRGEPAVVTFDERANESPSGSDVERADCFASSGNSATGAESAPGAGCSSVERNAAVADDAPVEESTPVEESATVAGLFTAKLTVAESATVEEMAAERTPGPGRRWRPRPIRRITDGLTPGQYAVYRLMYEAGAGQGAGDSSRIYTGGYADLRSLTGLSKRGIQNIVGDLQTKQVIGVCQKPGYHRTETTSYVVPDVDRVLEVWFANGWRYAFGKSKALSREQ